MSRILLFGNLFHGLRGAGINVSFQEWMTLMEALSTGCVKPDLKDFYHVARSILVKDEGHFDLWDEVFLAIFADGKLPVKEVEALLDWLKNPGPLPEISPEQWAQMEKLPLDKLRELFEERMKEQDERHDGGNRWIGTGGTSPFGHGGRNPAGVRVGGSGGQRSAVQIASERRFKDYRKDRVIDTRAMGLALKKLRRLSRTEGLPELDIEASIDETCRNAGDLSLIFQPPRENQAKVLLLMDVGGSMDVHARRAEALFSAANNLDHWKRFEAYYFHNCPYERLYTSMEQREWVPTVDLINNRPEDTFLIVVGDASMAPTELVSPHGAIDYFHHNDTPGIMWLHRLRKRFGRALWLNPIPRRWWSSWTIGAIEQLFPMFPLTIRGLEDGVDGLLRNKVIPPPDINPAMLRDLMWR